MKPKKNYHLLTLLLLLFSYSMCGQNILDKIKYTNWEGSGTLMGASATFKMSWTQELSDSFYHLNFENRRNVKNGSEIVFKAKAFYKVTNDSIVSGTWFDSRGISFPLKGKFLENELIIIWGNEQTEQGKTTYTYLDKKKIVVKDYILNNEKYFQFGAAEYIID